MSSTRIVTGDHQIDQACELALKTLRMNVSEKWGKICGVVGPAWGRGYPAWVHTFDNFWMNKVTPYVLTREQVEWAVVLLSGYQWPTGMCDGGIHDCPGPEDYQVFLRNKGEAWLREQSINNAYLRDHLFIMQVRDLWWHYGDLEVARKLFPNCRRALEYIYTLKDDDKDGMGETADIMEDVYAGAAGENAGPNAVERFIDQSLLFGALKNYAQLADALGQQGEAETARTRSADLARKVNELFWNDKGYYQFAIDSKTHKPVHPEITSTYGNGYAVLWDLVPQGRVARLLDYFTGWEFEVPGPILLPPIDLPIRNEQDRVRFAPGFYVNGGCGWGRGYMPSICLALFKHDRQEIATSYISKMARAANKAGAFYEFWTWEKYTGSTEPRGCKDYSETTSAFLDSVIHGLFGLSALEPGWGKLRFAPHPMPRKSASIVLELPGAPLEAEIEKSGKRWKVRLKSEVERTVEVAPPGVAAQRVSVKGERLLQL